jgi:hypothetical protein
MSTRSVSIVAVTLYLNPLVAVSGNISLSGGSSCKWCINPEVPEAKNRMDRSCVYLKHY